MILNGICKLLNNYKTFRKNILLNYNELYFYYNYYTINYFLGY